MLLSYLDVKLFNAPVMHYTKKYHNI